MTPSLTALPTWMLARAPEPPLAANPALPVPRISRATLAAVALAHAGLLAALLHATETSAPVAPPRPLKVSLIEPKPEVRQSEPKPQPPKPAIKPLPPSPVLAAQRPALTPDPRPAAEAPTPRPEPAPEVSSPPEPAPAPLAMAAKPAPPPPPGPPTPPRPADYLTNPKPPYPALSRRLGEEGTVRLNILINPDGSVARLELANSSGFPRLDQQAMETVQASWRFEPARQGDKPVAAWVIVPIQFILRS